MPVQSLKFVQAAGVIVHELDEELFLLHPDATDVLHLNPVAVLIWQRLATPADLADLVGHLHGLFAHAEPQLTADVAPVLEQFQQHGLVVEAH